MQRRGLSDVITTVLFVMLGLVGMVIVWNFVSPIAQQARINTDAYTTNINVPANSITVDPNTNTVGLSVQRDAGKGDVAGFIVGLEGPDGNIKTFRQNLTVNQLENKLLTVNYSAFPMSDVVSVTVTPIYRVNTTNQDVLGLPIKQVVPQANKKYKLPSGLTAYWKFDEASGTSFADSSSSGSYVGSLVGSNAQAGVAGKRGNALQFNADPAAYINISNSNSFNPSEVTVVAWINPSIQNYYLPYLIYNQAGTAGWRLYYFNSQWRFSIYGSAYAPTIIPVDSWSQVIGVYSSGHVKIYLNGQIQADIPTAAILSSSTNPIQIGTGYKGLIDEVMIYNRALNDTEIQGLYSSYG